MFPAVVVALLSTRDEPRAGGLFVSLHQGTQQRFCPPNCAAYFRENSAEANAVATLLALLHRDTATSSLSLSLCTSHFCLPLLQSSSGSACAVQFSAGEKAEVLCVQLVVLSYKASASAAATSSSMKVTVATEEGKSSQIEVSPCAAMLLQFVLWSARQ